MLHSHTLSNPPKSLSQLPCSTKAIQHSMSHVVSSHVLRKKTGGRIQSLFLKRKYKWSAKWLHKSHGKASTVRCTSTTQQPPGIYSPAFLVEMPSKCPLLPAMHVTNSRKADEFITVLEKDRRKASSKGPETRPKFLKFSGSYTHRPASFLSPSAFKPALCIEVAVSE